MTDELSEWQEASAESVPVEKIDQLVQDFVEARDDYDEKKKISNEAHHKCNELKMKLIELMRTAGKSKWELDGVGSATVKDTLTIPTPKTIESRQAFADYVRTKYGEDSFWKLFSVNSRTLISFYNEETANDPSLQIPGLDSPTVQSTIMFRRKKKCRNK